MQISPCIETRLQSGAGQKYVGARLEMHLNNFSVEVRFCPGHVLFHLIRKAPQLSWHLKWHCSTPPPLLDRDKEQLFQQFLEWRKRQTDVP
jgi:hypothetical protein